VEMIKEEQKTFGGSKVFYLNNTFDKLLVVSVPGNVEGKLNMVINRLNRINEKVSRINSKIKKEVGWTPSIPIESTLRDILDYWRKNA